jgi:hypothetical protein
MQDAKMSSWLRDCEGRGEVGVAAAGRCPEADLPLPW